MEEEGREEEGRKGKEKVVELCKECAIGNEDDDDNDEQGWTGTRVAIIKLLKV